MAGNVPDAQAELVRLTDSFRKFQLVRLALETGVIRELASGGRTAPDLAAALGFDRARLDRLLVGMTWAGVVAIDGTDRYGLSDLGRLLAAEERDGPALLVRFAAEFHYLPWAHVGAWLRGGSIPYHAAYGAPLFQDLDANHRRRMLFHAVMEAASRALVDAVLNSGRVPDAGLAVDVGGGTGALVTGLLRARPGLRGVVFDSSALRRVAENQIRAAGVDRRCRFVDGDIFQSVPGGAEVYLAKWVLHDWADARAKEFLRCCARAMTNESLLLVIERVLPARAHDRVLFAPSDVNMLVLTGGLERTRTEYEKLLRGVGLRLVGVDVLADGFSSLVATRT